MSLVTTSWTNGIFASIFCSDSLTFYKFERRVTEAVRGASVVGAVGAVVAETDQSTRSYANHGYLTLADFKVFKFCGFMYRH